MTAESVAARRHPLVQAWREARDGRGRPALFIEGPALAGEALAAGVSVRQALYTERFAENAAAAPLLHGLTAAGARAFLLSDDVMAFVSDLDTPPGLIVVADRAETSLERLLPRAETPLLVVLDGVQLPSNVGAVMRVAEAASAHGVAQTAGGADPLGPKSLRASAGSAFRLPVAGRVPHAQIIPFLLQNGVSPVVADAKSGLPFTEHDWTKPTALVLGAETSGRPGAGLATALREAGAGLTTVRIPMKESVESLNVSVAAGVLLYEARRQRDAAPKRAARKARKR